MGEELVFDILGMEPGQKSEVQTEVIDEARHDEATRKFTFASLMDLCHLKNAELETKTPKIQRSELYSVVIL